MPSLPPTPPLIPRRPPPRTSEPSRRRRFQLVKCLPLPPLSKTPSKPSRPCRKNSFNTSNSASRSPIEECRKTQPLIPNSKSISPMHMLPMFRFTLRRMPCLGSSRKPLGAEIKEFTSLFPIKSSEDTAAEVNTNVSTPFSKGGLDHSRCSRITLVIPAGRKTYVWPSSFFGYIRRQGPRTWEPPFSGNILFRLSPASSSSPFTLHLFPSPKTLG